MCKSIAVLAPKIHFQDLFSKNMATSLMEILKNTGNGLDNAEVKLVSSDNREFIAWKPMLCARSPVFNAMFNAREMKEAVERLITIKDISSKGLDIILTFIHTGTLKACWKEDNNLEEVLYGAHKLLIDDLILFFDHKLIDICNLKNCGKLYGLAMLYSMSNAVAQLKEYFESKFEDVEIKQAIQFQVVDPTSPQRQLDPICTTIENPDRSEMEEKAATERSEGCLRQLFCFP